MHWCGEPCIGVSNNACETAICRDQWPYCCHLGTMTTFVGGDDGSTKWNDLVPDAAVEHRLVGVWGTLQDTVYCAMSATMTSGPIHYLAAVYGSIDWDIVLSECDTSSSAVP